jgi:hypothetical protein
MSVFQSDHATALLLTGGTVLCTVSAGLVGQGDGCVIGWVVSMAVSIGC